MPVIEAIVRRPVLAAAAATLVDVRALRFRALAAASETAKLQDGMRADVGGVAGELRLGVGSGMTAPYAVFPSIWYTCR